MEVGPAPKRARLSTEDVLQELDDPMDEYEEFEFDDDGPVMDGSDDEFEDLQEEIEDSESEGELEDMHESIHMEESGRCVDSECETEADSSRSSPPTTSEQLPSATGTAPPVWSSTLSPVSVHPFTERVGPTCVIPSSPVEVLGLFLIDDVVELIVEQSNLYASQVLGEERYAQWEKMTSEEVKAYLGFKVLMGIVKLPSTMHYWSRNPALHQPSISDRISRDRFKQISRFLHFVDNTTLAERGHPGYDRLGKVRPVLDLLVQRFLTIYNPHCEQAVDEAMIPFQGRSTIKQFMPAKPTKRGIKAWCRADSHNGYISELQIYTGCAESGGSEQNLGTRVVLDLSHKLEGRFYHLYFDNYFTSASLLNTLLSRGVYGCGTTRQSYKGFPDTLKMKGKGKREQERLGLKERYTKATCTWSVYVYLHVSMCARASLISDVL